MAVDSVLTFATERILTKLTDLAAQEISLAWGFKAELNRLRKTLSTMEGYLADVAQGPQGRSKSVEDWVTNLKRLAQDADDVLDEFNYELLRRKVEIRNHMKKKVLNFFSLSNPVAFRLKIAHKIQKINASLEKLKSDASVIGLVVSNKIDAAPQGISGRIQTDSFPEKDGILGREEVVSNIVTTLTNSNINQENLAVMAIVGMAGLGKTTLAKSIYNDNSIKGYFDPKVWVCVSDPFDVKLILISMLESLSPLKASVKQSLDALLKHLQEELKGKKYLLVLDDVWNDNSTQWNDLMDRLLKLDSARGSTIIVTTRSAKVASISEKKLPRQDLKLLSTDECWSILKRAACSDGSSDIPLHLKSIGREIAKKCDGLPLMAKMANLAKLEFAALDLYGDNYLSWVLDAKIHLRANGLGKAIENGSDASPEENAKAMIFLRRHIHEALKSEYVVIDEPLVLWKALCDRYNHQKTVTLPRARYEWTHLRFQDFKTVSEYNSAMHRITSLMKLCGENISEEDMLEKTLSTFHASNVLLQQQYRHSGFTKYSELVSCLLLAEQNNELLLKNHQSRPTGSAPLPEINAATREVNSTSSRGSIHKRGRGGKRGR